MAFLIFARLFLRVFMLPKAIISFYFLLSSSKVLACAVCGFGDDESRSAFILTTGIMTFVPLIFIGSVIFYMRRRYLKLNSSSNTSDDTL